MSVIVIRKSEIKKYCLKEIEQSTEIITKNKMDMDYVLQSK